MLQGIKRLFSIGTLDKRDIRVEEYKEPMRGGGIVRYEPTKEISFALEAL